MQKGVVANSSASPKSYISSVVNTAAAAQQTSAVSKTLQTGFDDRLIRILANYLGRKVDQADTLNSLKLLNQDVKNA